MVYHVYVWDTHAGILEKKHRNAQLVRWSVFEKENALPHLHLYLWRVNVSVNDSSLNCLTTYDIPQRAGLQRVS